MSPQVGDAVEDRAVIAEDPGHGRVDPRRPVGLKFDQNVDLGELLAGRKPRHGFRAATAAAGYCVQGLGQGRQALLQRRRSRHFARRDEGRADRGILRRQEGRSWSSRASARSRARCAGIRDRRAGIVFDKPLEFDELAEWVGKRLELASLKASYKAQLSAHLFPARSTTKERTMAERSRNPRGRMLLVHRGGVPRRRRGEDRSKAAIPAATSPTRPTSRSAAAIPAMPRRSGSPSTLSS